MTTVILKQFVCIYALKHTHTHNVILACMRGCHVDMKTSYSDNPTTHCTLKVWKGYLHTVNICVLCRTFV